LKNFEIRSGDFIVSCSGTIGEIVRVPEDIQRGVINQALLRIRINPEVVYPLFFLYQFQSDKMRHTIVDHSHGGAMANLVGMDVFRKVMFSIPPLPEQRKIADILGAWDAAIATMERMITALQKRKRGLMQRVLTGQVRFPEFVRPNGTQDTKYGSIPADWSHRAIGDIAVEVSSKNGRKKSLPVLSCTKYDGLVDSLEYFGRQIFSEDVSKYKVVKRGQFAYATNHIEEGSIGYQDVYDEAVVSPMYTVFETKVRVNDVYLYRLLKTELYRHIFESNTSGSVNRRGGLRWSDFAKIKVPLPSLDEQCKIVEVLDAADSEIKTSMKLRGQLIAQKQGLMQRLLTGQVRVNVDKVDEEEE